MMMRQVKEHKATAEDVYLSSFDNPTLTLTLSQPTLQSGMNPYYKINPSTNNNIFPSLPFAPLDPLSVLFLRIPKSASTRFLTLASNLSHKKNFKITEFPDLRDAVGGSSESR